ncbi:MAG: RNA methyltransferase [Bacteroidales bacterium]|jgi:tRNA (guanosine-2'-O-)-methyltransferase|nr:RNA methyltransferase [Bacteroidales bacterium]
MYTLDQKQALLNHLRNFVKDERASRFEQVINSRTRHLTIALENIFQSQNASAVLRSCECMGVQDVHVIENSYKFETHPDIALGANKWLDIFQYNAENADNTARAIERLRNDGYKIVATTPHKNDFSLEELPIDDKIALFFGTELTGISDEVIEQADYFMQIPMCGFTESYNISVSAALAMYELTKRVRQSSVKWQLSEEERVDILLAWLTRSIRMSEQIIEEWQKKIQP